MASITIITGCPGSGKTTLSNRLAQGLPKGVHLHADDFYDYIAQKISPILPESHQQNTTVMRAIARATAAYVTGDYDLVLDGIFGFWFLPILAEEFQSLSCPVNYLVIRLPLEATILRATTRLKNPASEEIIRHMYPLCELPTLTRSTGYSVGFRTHRRVPQMRLSSHFWSYLPSYGRDG
jgi:tRNA uridine 5-carbamoylmethylation protein Kti12